MRCLTSKICIGHGFRFDWNLCDDHIFAPWSPDVTIGCTRIFLHTALGQWGPVIETYSNSDFIDLLMSGVKSFESYFVQVEHRWPPLWCHLRSFGATSHCSHILLGRGCGMRNLCPRASQWAGLHHWILGVKHLDPGDQQAPFLIIYWLNCLFAYILYHLMTYFWDNRNHPMSIPFLSCVLFVSTFICPGFLLFGVSGPCIFNCTLSFGRLAFTWKDMSAQVNRRPWPCPGWTHLIAAVLPLFTR